MGSFRCGKFVADPPMAKCEPWVGHPNLWLKALGGCGDVGRVAGPSTASFAVKLQETSLRMTASFFLL
jgi:hypothetical protein